MPLIGASTSARRAVVSGSATKVRSSAASTRAGLPTATAPAGTNQKLAENQKPEEVRLKVFLPRDGSVTIPSLYGLWRGADWQERETYDMFGIVYDGHPHPKRLLMPEDWKGWPLRKDYVQPDFYEMQDAY